jgi:hypothetical protein
VSDSPPDAEHRRHPRFELLASVELHQGDETLILPARNLSLGGVSLGTDGHDLSSMAVGGVHELVLFDALDEATPPVRAPAEVVRHEREAIAFKWSQPEAATRQLSALLKTLRPRADR